MVEFPVEFPREIPQNQNRGISTEFPIRDTKPWNFVLTAWINWLILNCNYVCYNSFIITNLPKIYSIIGNKIKSASTIEQLNS